MAEEPTQGETKPQPPAPEGTSKMGIGCVVVVVAIIVGIFVVVLIGSGGVTYLAGIDPVNLTDEALHAVTSKYRLLHIWRTEARTGRGGPGDLAWVWPAATMILLPLLLFRRRRRR